MRVAIDDPDVNSKTPEFCARFCRYLGSNSPFGTASKKYREHLATQKHTDNIQAHWAQWILSLQPPANTQEGPLHTEEDLDDHQELPPDEGEDSVEDFQQNGTGEEDEEDLEPLEEFVGGERRAAAAANEVITLEQEGRKAREAREQAADILSHLESMRDQTPQFVWYYSGQEDQQSPVGPLSEPQVPLTPTAAEKTCESRHLSLFSRGSTHNLPFCQMLLFLKPSTSRPPTILKR